MCKLTYSSSVKILKNFLFELCYQIIRSAKYPEQSKSMPEIYAWNLCLKIKSGFARFYMWMSQINRIFNYWDSNSIYSLLTAFFG